MKKLFIAASLICTPVQAHDWYPLSCCSNSDCSVVDKAEIVNLPAASQSLPVMAVTTKHGTVIVPPNFERRASPDGQMHACMRPDGNGGMRLLCIFLPPGL